jgi:propionyl-CoA carboxylase beta chain
MFGRLKKLLSYVPQNNKETTPKLPYIVSDEYRDELMNIVPENANKPYDMHDVIKGIIDEDSFFEIHKNYAENIIVGFARLAGRSIGIVANNPMYLAGCLDVKSSIKAARFTRFCDCFNIPLLVLEMCLVFFQEQTKNGMELLYMVPNCCML